MSWNRPNNGEAVSRPLQKRSGDRFPVHGAIAGAIVVLGAAVVAWWLWPEPKRGEDAASTAKKLIHEVTPAVAPKEEEKPTAKLRSLTVNGKTHPDFVPIGIQRMRKKVHEVRTNNLADASAEVPYRNATEQVLTAIFMTEPGNMPPPTTMLTLSQEERENIVFRLLEKTEITDKDSEELAVAKEVLIEAKAEMRKYLKDGGDPESFLSHYYNELDKAYSERNLVRSEVMHVFEKDPQIGREFLDKANQQLKAKGIKTIEMPEQFIQMMESKGELK